MLGKKQREDNRNFVRVWNGISSVVSKDQIDERIERTLTSMRPVLAKYPKYGAAWSGGKDSVVVDFLLRKLGRKFPSCIGMTNDLEYPEFMRYVTNNMPNDLKVYMSGHTLEWLSRHQDRLFPKSADIAKLWFGEIQHKAQNKFFAEKGLDVLITGRRLKDSNYVGKDGIYRNKGTNVLRYSPIYDWTHEEVLAVMHYYELPLAPFYSWPNGWIVGSGCWAARQWTGSLEQGWREVYTIDPNVVKTASEFIPSAAEFIKKIGG
jgi:3'-phosphoadenosine 5'-phosphosulfate sulfotransferase (PAPS reductase)/FAD synthetase